MGFIIPWPSILRSSVNGINKGMFGCNFPKKHHPKICNFPKILESCLYFLQIPRILWNENTSGTGHVASAMCSMRKWCLKIETSHNNNNNNTSKKKSHAKLGILDTTFIKTNKRERSINYIWWQCQNADNKQKREQMKLL